MNRNSLMKCCTIGAMVGGLALASTAWAGPLGSAGFGAAGGIGGSFRDRMTGPAGFGGNGALGAGGEFSGRVDRSNQALWHARRASDDAMQTQRATLHAGESAAAATTTGAATRGASAGSDATAGAERVAAARRQVNASSTADATAGARAGRGHIEGSSQSQAEVSYGR